MFIIFFWGQLGLVDGITIASELVSYFHDYIIMILLCIAFIVTYMFFSILYITYLDKKTSEIHSLEFFWTFIPMLILVFIAYPSLFLLYFIEEISSPLVVVKIIGHQWYWEYQYLNNWLNKSIDSYILWSLDQFPLFYTLDVDSRLVLPSFSSIQLIVTSADVLHSWALPSFSLKIDACPGRLNYISLKSLSSGIFFGQCSEICGSNHSFMPICVEIVPVSEFLYFVDNL